MKMMKMMKMKMMKMIFKTNTCRRFLVETFPGALRNKRQSEERRKIFFVDSSSAAVNCRKRRSFWRSDMLSTTHFRPYIVSLSGRLQCTFRRTLHCLFVKSLAFVVLSLARATGSLAGGFLVAVADCALVAVACFCWLFFMRLRINGPLCLTVSPFHLHNGLRPN